MEFIIKKVKVDSKLEIIVEYELLKDDEGETVFINRIMIPDFMSLDLSDYLSDWTKDLIRSRILEGKGVEHYDESKGIPF